MSIAPPETYTITVELQGPEAILLAEDMEDRVAQLDAREKAEGLMNEEWLIRAAYTDLISRIGQVNPDW